MDENILVIKLSAFGDFIQALGPMAAIRRHHPDARITLLTTAPFVTLARQSGYFDAVRVDMRPKWKNPLKILQLARELRAGRFARVYDLQNNDRTAFYFKLFSPHPPEWVGAARGASHRNASAERTSGHAFDGHVQTLKMAGIDHVAVDALDWVRGDASHFGLPHPFLLFAPGSSPERPEKRWPAESFGDLARHVYGWGYVPVIIGTEEEQPLARIMKQKCPAAINVCGQTAMTDLVLLAREAAGAIGNDTGPMHVIAPTGCPTWVLFSDHSDPVRHKPLGPRVRVIHFSENIFEEISARDFRHKGCVTAAL
jgi:ADP-heptose:LPS heptosyltransferase